MRGIEDLFWRQQKQLKATLEVAREEISHSGAKGVASELEWTNLLRAHLPNRYQVCKGFVLDFEGNKSEEIDLVVYDNQYTPVLLNRQEQRFVPAESVYAVFEVKQLLDRRNLEAAGQKAASVRALVRTSAEIHHAGGMHKPRDPFRILAGILAYESDWNPPLGDSLKQGLDGLSDNCRIDLGCALRHGSFDAAYSDRRGETELRCSRSATGLAYLFFELLARLQVLGTAPAIEYSLYTKRLRG